ncbi:MAG TPA: hypothetical protein VGD34_25105 [Kribbella sp.]
MIDDGEMIVINDWFLTAHEAVQHCLLFLAVGCYAVMFREIAQEVRG